MSDLDNVTLTNYLLFIRLQRCCRMLSVSLTHCPGNSQDVTPARTEHSSKLQGTTKFKAWRKLESTVRHSYSSEFKHTRQR